MPPKRKRSTAVVADTVVKSHTSIPLPANVAPKPPLPNPPTRRSSTRNAAKISTNPDVNEQIIDAPSAVRASLDDVLDDGPPPGIVKKESESEDSEDSALSDVPDIAPPLPKKRATGTKAVVKETVAVVKSEGASAEPAPKTPPVKKGGNGEESIAGDPEAEDDEPVDEEELKEALSRPPPVNSDYLPLPWKGRLGYACLNTYLRFSNPPVFSSRTCRIASILEHRHPLKDPSQPEHATKNRPDKDQPADIARGQAYVESIGIANARDIVKMIRWNDRYGIKFLRLSSEMFPFASHPEYGYSLAPFASEALAEAGKVIAELGHRVSTHPGQFTQLGSPRKSVIDNALRDLTYHDELLSLLKLPPQQDRDAVMILHLGGMFGDKAATLDRFRANYAGLSASIKNRLVLENGDVIWSVHDLLPLCEELNIPMVLDYHHHNIIFDAAQIREGTKDIMELYPRIKATWDRKNITQKMHYSEPTPAAITGRQRRKHSPRVATLPPCAPDMDLMIEAKDKEQAVFELMKTFKLPGFDTFNDIIPHVRTDDNKALNAPQRKKKATPKKTNAKKGKTEVADDVAELESKGEEEDTAPVEIPDDEVGMGGPDGRVYWPPGMEDWLRPAKRIVKPKPNPSMPSLLTPAQKKKAAADLASVASAVKVEAEAEDEAEVDPNETAATRKAKAAMKAADARKARAAAEKAGVPKKSAPRVQKEKGRKVKKEAKSVPTPSTSDGGEDLSEPPLDTDAEEAETEVPAVKVTARPTGARVSQRAGRKAKVSYVEKGDDEMDEE
ncbi:hypothetical protein B0A49_09268 [Cryomyces minteri]|uniref:UV-damage endonuclease n=1 Tax=Cryomyces minteri TaxID=331657 RepID=A0A4U0WHP8_9PEZI|nr:hypothetical protein B0A49_09268 [Cryomyces minteri]